jgi:hypothetical protein
MGKKLQRTPTLENAFDATMAYLKMEATWNLYNSDTLCLQN